MAQRGFPGIHAGAPPIQKPPRGLLEGASRTGPQQRPSRDLQCCFLKANRRHKYHCSAFESALGSPPHPAGRVEARLRRGERHGCRPSPAGPWKAHRGVPCASVPERGHPEPKRRANAGAATPRPARKQNDPNPTACTKSICCLWANVLIRHRSTNTRRSLVTCQLLVTEAHPLSNIHWSSTR
jgi:hypothetical protein